MSLAACFIVQTEQLVGWGWVVQTEQLMGAAHNALHSCSRPLHPASCPQFRKAAACTDLPLCHSLSWIPCRLQGGNPGDARPAHRRPHLQHGRCRWAQSSVPTANCCTEASSMPAAVPTSNAQLGSFAKLLQLRPLCCCCCLTKPCLPLLPRASPVLLARRGRQPHAPLCGLRSHQARPGAAGQEPAGERGGEQTKCQTCWSR